MARDSKFGDDGEIVRQVIAGATPTAVGSFGELQWNFNNIMAADSNLVWDPDLTPSKLTVTGQAEVTANLTVGGNLASTTGNISTGGNLTIGGTTELSAVTMKGHIIPDTNDVYDIGSASFKIRDMYVSDSTIHMGDEATIKSEGTAIVVQDLKTSDLHLDNTQREGNNVDGTNGSWTFQEGADNLFLLNNITGKKYKINLTEI